MIHKKFFALKAISLLAVAAILLTGCSAAEEITGADTDETTFTADTAEISQTESVTVTAEATEEQSEDTSEDTSGESDGTEGSSQAPGTTSTGTAASTTSTGAAATTTTAKSSAATTPKPSAPAPETTTITKPETTTTTTSTTTPTTTTTTTTATTPVTTTAPGTTAPAAPNPSDVYKILISFKEKYPEGTPWTNETRTYTSTTIVPGVYFRGDGCVAFAFELSDAAFSPLPRREHHNISDIKIGDILRLDNSHSVIVLEVKSDRVVIAEGNYNSSVHWGRELKFSELEKSLNYIWTRYP